MPDKKKVGNACRTKNQVRGSKSKGASFEYDVWESLKQVYPDILVTKQLGFVSQYDLITERNKAIFECKCHKGFSWNELEGYLNKLVSRVSHEYDCYVVFKANRQPILVMYYQYNHVIVKKFEDKFCPFIKHKPIKRGVKN